MSNPEASSAAPPPPSSGREEAIWQAILDSARDAIISIDTGGHITVFNQAAELMFGFSAAETIGRRVEMLMPPPYCDQHVDYLRAYESTGVPKAIGRIRHVEARRRNGEVFPIELSVAEARFAFEVRYTAIIRDVTEQKQAEAELQSRVRQLASLTSLGLRALSNPDLPGLMNEAVRAVAETLGVDNCCLFGVVPPGLELQIQAGVGWRQQVVGLRCSATDAGTLPARVLAAQVPLPLEQTDRDFIGTLASAERALRGGIGVVVTAPRRKVGVLAAYTVAVRSFSPNDVNFLQSVANVLAGAAARADAERDVMEARRGAAQRERMADIGAISTRMVHDLGNPLAALAMQAQLILRRAKRGDFQPVEPVLQPTEQLIATLRRLQDLIRDLNDFARDQRLELTTWDIRQFLQGVAELWQPLADSRAISLPVVVDGAAISLRGDVDKLRRVFDNLLKNALEAITEAQGEVRLQAELIEGKTVRVTISDSGAGIPAGVDVFRLFETSKADGTGIGLAVAKQIVQAHGGMIDHFPNQPVGTIFVVELPKDGPPFDSGAVTLG